MAEKEMIPDKVGFGRFHSPEEVVLIARIRR